MEAQKYQSVITDPLNDFLIRQIKTNFDLRSIVGFLVRESCIWK